MGSIIKHEFVTDKWFQDYLLLSKCRPDFLHFEKIKKKIRAVAGQLSLPELLPIANKIKMHLTKKKKKRNSNSLEYEEVLYFDLQPQPMACTLGSVVMEWKQTLFEIRMLSDD